MSKGERIKLLRENANMNQTEMANKIGVSKQTLYKYENDIVTNIPSDKIEAIAAITGSTPAFIMGWEKIETQTGDSEINVLQGSLSSDEKHLLEIYKKLNDIGKQEARKRIQELSEIERYKKGINASSAEMAG